MNHEKCKIQTAVEAVRKQALTECRIALNNAASALGELGIVSTFSMVADHDGPRLKILIDHIVNGSISMELENIGSETADRADRLMGADLIDLASLADDHGITYSEKKINRLCRSDTPNKERKFKQKLIAKILAKASPGNIDAWIATYADVDDDSDFPGAEIDLTDLRMELMQFPLFDLSVFAEETANTHRLPTLAKIVKHGDTIGDEDSVALKKFKAKLVNALVAEVDPKFLENWTDQNDLLKEEDDDTITASDMVVELSKFSLTDLKGAADEFEIKIHKLVKNKVDDVQLACAIAAKLVEKVGVAALVDWIDEFKEELDDEDEDDEDEDDDTSAPRAMSEADHLCASLYAADLKRLCNHLSAKVKTNRKIKGELAPTKSQMARAICKQFDKKKIVAALVKLGLPHTPKL